MRIATYNLLHGIPLLAAMRTGVPPQAMPAVDAELLRSAIHDLAPDVIGMQEVDHEQERSAGMHQVKVIAEAMQARWWMFAPAVHGTPGEQWNPAGPDDAHTVHDDMPPGPQYGVGLVSRFPVLHHRNITLRGAKASLPLLVPTPQGNKVMRVHDEPRAAIAAVVHTPGGVVTVATAHLSFIPGANIRQLRQLVRWLSVLPRPLFLIGDFNLPGRIPAITTKFRPLAKAATYPSYKPMIQFDHILADGFTASPKAVHVLPLPVSDHCALAVDLAL